MTCATVTPEHWEDIDDDALDDEYNGKDPSQSHLECCAICLDPRSEPNQMALLLPCQHRCDADCIEQWRSRQVDLPQTPCPLCRTPIDRVVVGAEIELILQLGAKIEDDSETDNHHTNNSHNYSRFQHSKGRNRHAGRRWGPMPALQSRSRYVDEDDDVYFSTQDELSQWCAVEDAMIERAILANERRRREKNWMERD